MNKMKMSVCILAIILSVSTQSLVLSSNPGNTNPVESDERTNWNFETNGRIYSSPVVDGDLVLVGSGDAHIYAIDKNTGDKVWSYKTEGEVHSSPVISDNKVIIGSADGNLYALDVKTGNLQWKFSSKGETQKDLWDYYLSSPAVYNELVYWGSGDGFLYALDDETGTVKWKFDSGAIIHASPLVYEGNVYVGNYNGFFYAINAADGEMKWQFRTIGDTFFPNGEVQKEAVADNGVIYFGSRDFNVYALDAKTGRGMWNMKEQGSWVIAAPLVYKDNIYFGTSDTHRFYSMSKNRGKLQWQIQVPMRVYGSAVAYNDVVYFGCFDGKLYGVDSLSGEIVFEYQTLGSKQHYDGVFTSEGKFREDFELYGTNYLESERIIHTLGSILSTPALHDGSIYFGSSDGNVYSVNLE